VRRRPPPEPWTLAEVALDAPLPLLREAPHARHRVLVRLHGHPLGIVDVDGRDPAALDPRALGDRIRRELAPELEAHLEADGLRPPGRGLARPPGGCAYDVPLAQEPFVTVVIPTRGRSPLLARCVASLLGGEHRSLELLVVDNGDGPDVRRLVAERAASDRRIRYLREPRSGAAWARNRGLAAARAPIVAFVDDDVVVDARWLRCVSGAFHAAPGVACVTSLIMPLELETPAQLWLEQFGGFQKGFRRQVFDLDAHRGPGALYPYNAGAFGSGAAMAFDRRALESAGGFDPRLARGGEDLDLFLHVVLSGRRLVYEPAAIVWHRHPRGYATLRRTMFDYGAGLTSLLTKRALTSPRAARDIALRVPAGVRYALAPASAKNAAKRPGYPRELTWRERGGMLAGPLLYGRAAWRDHMGPWTSAS
jgi:GT2 family glycosyltransferase